MKILALGKRGRFMDDPEWILDPSKVGVDEAIILISHGVPDKADLDAVQCPVVAALMMQGNHSVDSDSFKRFKQRCSGLHSCERFFRLTIGWDTQDFTRDKWVLVREFLFSGVALPADHETQQLLGFDTPVRRLTLQFALQLAREQVDKPNIDIVKLVTPAVEDLKEEFPLLLGELQAAKTPNERQNVIDKALGELSSN